MDDKELLELAAKAAGIHGLYRVNGYRKESGISETMDGPLWNPLTNDGDALRLAVKLNIEVAPEASYITVYASQLDSDWNNHELVGKDGPYAATRRAIVRAAAEIGKEQK